MTIWLAQMQITVTGISYLRKGTVVPEVTFVREAVADITKFAFLYVLLDRVQRFLLADLKS